MRRLLLWLFTHGVAVAVGFALGIYLLPILTAPPSPDAAMLEAEAANASFTVELTRDLRGSDLLHWGEGTISLTPTMIVHEGALAPGPDYKLYLTTEFVDHEDVFEPIKAEAALIGDVDTFGGFILEIPEGIDLTAYTTVVVWCEAFGEFITAGQYR
ncbi:DM13 domain-containing protein [Marivita hallyeonensis]|uniref:Electron transfer DM13 n=1 Tax=Marivita hallyeonensis TaxID=996342 RepID=A0A1M5QPX3_9RHOB|nr:DM13 domain-containing protein [Marivita hallyeonensis]SHH15988.1 Electron transfer DM13 [Marivita hallyeonensis]